ITPSDAAASSRSVSRSSRLPRRTSAPVAARAAAEASERASPTTSWSAPSSSGTTAEPIQPDAPVTKTRMVTPFRGDVSACRHPSRVMSAAVVSTIRAMGRWEPNARGRLEQAAMELYGERGFDQTTVAEIAARAGLAERTFFRHYADNGE